MPFDEPTYIAPGDAGNDWDYLAWPKVRQLTRAANAGLFQSFRNRLINGDFSIWQRGTSGLTSGGLALTADRWQLVAAGANNSAQRVAGTRGYAIQITGATSNSATQLAQRIESMNIADLIGRRVRIKARIKGSGASTASIRILYPTAPDNYSGNTEPVAGQAVAFGTSFTDVEVGFTLNAAAVNGACVIIDFGAVGNAVTRTVEEVQLEPVDSTDDRSSPFERLPYEMQLLRSQRYYRRYGGAALFDYIGTGWCISTTQVDLYMSFGVAMRGSPALSVGDATKFAVTDANTSTSSTAVTLNSNYNYTKDGALVLLSGLTGLTTGRPCRVYAASSVLGWMGFDAEI